MILCNQMQAIVDTLVLNFSHGRKCSGRDMEIWSGQQRFQRYIVCAAAHLFLFLRFIFDHFTVYFAPTFFIAFKEGEHNTNLYATKKILIWFWLATILRHLGYGVSWRPPCTEAILKWNVGPAPNTNSPRSTMWRVYHGGENQNCCCGFHDE